MPCCYVVPPSLSGLLRRMFFLVVGGWLEIPKMLPAQSSSCHGCHATVFSPHDQDIWGWFPVWWTHLLVSANISKSSVLPEMVVAILFVWATHYSTTPPEPCSSPRICSRTHSGLWVWSGACSSPWICSSSSWGRSVHFELLACPVPDKEGYLWALCLSCHGQGGRPWTLCLHCYGQKCPLWTLCCSCFNRRPCVNSLCSLFQSCLIRLHLSSTEMVLSAISSTLVIISSTVGILVPICSAVVVLSSTLVLFSSTLWSSAPLWWSSAQPALCWFPTPLALPQSPGPPPPQRPGPPSLPTVLPSLASLLDFCDTLGSIWKATP